MTCSVTLDKVLSFPENQNEGRGGWLKIKDPSHSLVLKNGSNWTSGYLPLWSVGMEPLSPLQQPTCLLPAPQFQLWGQGPKTQTTFRPQMPPVVDMPKLRQCLLHTNAAKPEVQTPSRLAGHQAQLTWDACKPSTISQASVCQPLLECLM